MDVKIKFLNNTLDKEVHMEYEEFIMPKQEHKVCKLLRSLYELE